MPARRLFPLPDAELAPRIAALAEPMAVCVHGLRRARLEAGQRVMVLGAGSIGLLTVAAARALGRSARTLALPAPLVRGVLGFVGFASRVLGRAPLLDGDKARELLAVTKRQSALIEEARMLRRLRDLPRSDRATLVAKGEQPVDQRELLEEIDAEIHRGKDVLKDVRSCQDDPDRAEGTVASGALGED